MDGAENHFLAQLKYATLHTCLRVSDQDRDPPNKNWLAPPMNALLSHLKNIPHPPQHTSLILYSMKKITLYIQQSVSWSRFLRPCNATSEEENATGEEMVGGGARNGEAKKGGGGGGSVSRMEVDWHWALVSLHPLKSNVGCLPLLSLSLLLETNTLRHTLHDWAQGAPFAEQLTAYKI